MENFLARWSRRKAEYRNADAEPEETRHAAQDVREPHAAETMPQQGSAPLPTLDDVAHLEPDADYSRFLAGGIEKTVRRAAMKKLFSDPHFHIMDGLDIYIDDYNKPSPVSPAMLAALTHTQSLFNAVAEEEARQAEAQLLLESDEAGQGVEPGEVPEDGRQNSQHNTQASGEGGTPDEAPLGEPAGNGTDAADDAAGQPAPVQASEDDTDGMHAAQGRD